MAGGTKKWSAETKSDFITTFFLGWPSKKVFEHEIPGVKKLPTQDRKVLSVLYKILNQTMFPVIVDVLYNINVKLTFVLVVFKLLRFLRGR